MSNRSNQQNRGRWKKDREDRGIYKRGRIWYVRYVDQYGKIHSESVGPSKVLALKVYQKRKTEIAEGRYFPELCRRNVTFDELARDVITRSRAEHNIQNSGKRFRPYRYRIVTEWFKGRPAALITPQDIAAKLAANCRTPANYNRYRVALSHIYKIGIENKKVVENPARLVKLQKENNERVRWLEPEEETALRAAIQRLCPECEPELDLALHTGMRWSEQYGLHWEQVDLKRNQITLTQPKGGKRQYVRINASAREALTKLRTLAPKSALVCPQHDEWTHREWWDAVRKEAKVNDFHWHDLRHTFASRLVMDGVDILTVNKLLRHKTLQVTMRYAHLAATHLQEAVERLAKPAAGVSPGVQAPIDTAARKPAIVH